MNRSPRRLAALAAFAVGIALAVGGAASAATAGHRPATEPKPTIVLVHGAFADSSGWADVQTRLAKDGYPVVAFSNPLRGVEHDGAYLASFLTTIDGPIVLVGHSYGGAVITQAGATDPDVKSLVYIAAFALAAGESVAEASALNGGSNDLLSHIDLRPFPGAAEGDADATIDPAWFPRLFAQDVPRRLAETMAAMQRPAALASLGLPATEAAWETIPSWYMVARDDRIIPPVAERAMAERAGATTVEVASSHVPMISHPGAVVRLIESAAR
ncbi:alpha/beta fold hydrolase [Demequina iriomotensis]|uniref:alpha/beta fold hydrolase n=1 Tax=Demequina iriomotensis TaxID=1536641 RepID=UPI0007834E80|nr:alpha/beta hydrolase [Demequina iriomotensis]